MVKYWAHSCLDHLFLHMLLEETNMQPKNDLSVFSSFSFSYTSTFSTPFSSPLPPPPPAYPPAPSPPPASSSVSSILLILKTVYTRRAVLWMYVALVEKTGWLPNRRGEVCVSPGQCWFLTWENQGFRICWWLKTAFMYSQSWLLVTIKVLFCCKVLF